MSLRHQTLAHWPRLCRPSNHENGGRHRSPRDSARPYTLSWRFSQILPRHGGMAPPWRIFDNTSSLHDFNELLPPADTSAKELEQRSTFFMLMALYGLPPDYLGIRDHILGSPTMPTLSTVSSLLQILAKQLIELVTTPTLIDTSALASQSSRSCSGRFFPKCDHCHRLGHTIDKYWTLHGWPPQTVNVAQATAPAASESRDQHKPSPADYADFLKWYEQCQSSSSTASIMHTGNSFACLSQSTSLGHGSLILLPLITSLVIKLFFLIFLFMVI